MHVFCKVKETNLGHLKNTMCLSPCKPRYLKLFILRVMKQNQRQSKKEGDCTSTREFGIPQFANS